MDGLLRCQWRRRRGVHGTVGRCKVEHTRVDGLGPLLSLPLLAPDRVVAPRAATPLATGWLVAMLLAVPVAVIVVLVATAAVGYAPPVVHRGRSASSTCCRHLGEDYARNWSPHFRFAIDRSLDFLNVPK